MRAQKTLLLASLVFTCIGFCVAQSQMEAKHAHVELVADPQTTGSMLAGVHFQLEPGWHIYWINPGDSGQPPAFYWTLPLGATAGEVQWPRPERLQTGAKINF
jgi:DsbC/DsbD-like thiol-disulfide interchange protein